MNKKKYTPASSQVIGYQQDIVCTSGPGTQTTIRMENNPDKKANPIWGVL